MFTLLENLNILTSHIQPDIWCILIYIYIPYEAPNRVLYVFIPFHCLLCRYEEQLKETKLQKEDLSDMVAEHAAKQKVGVD